MDEMIISYPFWKGFKQISNMICSFNVAYIDGCDTKRCEWGGRFVDWSEFFILNATNTKPFLVEIPRPYASLLASGDAQSNAVEVEIQMS